MTEQLSQLQRQRRDDVSVEIAHALCVCNRDNLEPLQQLLLQDRSISQADASERAKVESMLIVAFLRWQELVASRKPEAAEDVVSMMLRSVTARWNGELQASLYAMVARQFIAQGNRSAAERVLKEFTELPEVKVNPLLNLATWLIEQQMPQIAQQSIEKAAVVWHTVLRKSDGAQSLGALLGTAEQRSQLTVDEGETIAQLQHLDNSWDAWGLDTTLAYSWLYCWLLPNDGGFDFG